MSAGPLTIETMIVERAQAGGMGSDLVEVWLSADGNRVLGCSPRSALEAGRTNEVIAALDWLLTGRPPRCSFPSCRCEWSRRREHCPYYGGSSKGEQ